MMTPESDFSTIDFGDKRLHKRLKAVIENSRKNGRVSKSGVFVDTE